MAFYLTYILTVYLTYILTLSFSILPDMFSDLPSGCLSDIISLEILCGRGPAGNTLMLSLLFGSGGERCDLAPAVGVRGALILSLLFGSDGERSDPQLAVRVRQGTL